MTPVPGCDNSITKCFQWKSKTDFKIMGQSNPDTFTHLCDLEGKVMAWASLFSSLPWVVLLFIAMMKPSQHHKDGVFNPDLQGLAH